MPVGDNTQQYDRITQILQQQAPKQLPFNEQQAILFANALSPQNAVNAYSQRQTELQNEPIQREMDLLKVFEAKKNAGDAQAQALERRISLFTGGDPEGTAMFLRELHNDPDEIDPSNSFQVMTKLASIAKKTGYQSPVIAASARENQLKLQKLESEINKNNMPKPLSKEGKIAADIQAGYITPEQAAQANKPKLTANDAKELVNAKKTIIASPNAKAKLQEALGLNKEAFEGGALGVETKSAIARRTGTYDKTLAATTKLQNIAWRNVLSSLKSTFGGMPTEGERAVLAKVEGAIDGTREEREAVLKEAIDAVDARASEAQSLIDILEDGKTIDEVAGASNGGGLSDLSDDDLLKLLEQ